MAKQTINIGASPNDGTGTPLRTAFDYTNQNFTELYTATGPSGNNIVVPGTATITGDLTVDTNVLKVDTLNNRVGVGTASPADTLDVNGRITALRYLSSSSNAALPSFAVSAGNGAYNSGTNEIGFSINSTSAMTLNSTGLGIGTASPFQKLTVVGIGYFAGGASSTEQLRLGFTDGTSYWGIGRDNVTTGNLIINNAGSSVATFSTSGNVGIGGSPTVRLDVQNASGDVQARIKSATANSTLSFDYVNNYGSIVIRKSGTDVWLSGVIGDAAATPNYKIQNGSAVGVQLVSGATAWTTLSDETVKDIIEPISNAVAKVGSLRSVIGKFKTDDSSKRRSFLIAQDVQSVLPEAVDVIGENNELGLRYTEIIPLLVAAIKELTTRVQTLEAK